jgi:hypothetical protein
LPVGSAIFVARLAPGAKAEIQQNNTIRIKGVTKASGDAVTGRGVNPLLKTSPRSKQRHHNSKFTTGQKV